ncbi:hypothetical protein [uncultured Nostoc sp.]|uniref:hypothetical protein n=1 Tax=uncultured Nostoc sp. TaxID=340711 RepID=UPI0035CAD19C
MEYKTLEGCLHYYFHSSRGLVAGEAVSVATMSTTGYAYAPVIHALCREGAFFMKL